MRHDFHPSMGTLKSMFHIHMAIKEQQCYTKFEEYYLESWRECLFFEITNSSFYFLKHSIIYLFDISQQYSS